MKLNIPPVCFLTSYSYGNNFVREDSDDESLSVEALAEELNRHIDYLLADID